MKNNKVCILGLGYIGLPTAAFLASKKIPVLGIDTNEKKVSEIKSCRHFTKETGLESLLKYSIEKGFLKVQKSPEKSDIFIITVPTPFKKNKNQGIPSPDISFIKSAINSIAKLLKKGNLIIIESTSPVGTTEKIAKLLSKLRPDLFFPSGSKQNKKPDVNIAYCPERVIPGNILKELNENDRIIGGLTKFCSKKAFEFYKKFISGSLFLTDSRSAEMSKLVENAYRDINIAYANELSIACDELNLNVYEIIKLSNRHPRVNILNPGPGVGGHCIAVDPWFIASSVPKQTPLIQTARQTNEQKMKWVIKKINKEIAGIKKKNISISFYGITYKPNIDDFRESPALEIAKVFSKKKNVKCQIIEPNLKFLPKEIKTCNKVEINSIKKSDIHVLLVGHHQFEKKIPKNGIIIDTQGFWIK